MNINMIMLEVLYPTCAVTSWQNHTQAVVVSEGYIILKTVE